MFTFTFWIKLHIDAVAAHEGSHWWEFWFERSLWLVGCVPVNHAWRAVPTSGCAGSCWHVSGRSFDSGCEEEELYSSRFRVLGRGRRKCTWRGTIGISLFVRVNISNNIFIKSSDNRENTTCLHTARVVSSRCPQAPTFIFNSKRDHLHHVLCLNVHRKWLS